MILIVIGTIFASVAFVDSESAIGPKVVHGEPANIKDYGYSAYFITLGDEKFVCGSSILNQKIILTAAHCFEHALKDTKILITVGQRNHKKGFSYRVVASKVHEKYDEENVNNDIALAMVSREIQLGTTMYRVALSKSTPNKDTLAKIAGWGLIDEERLIQTNFLYVTQQKIMLRHDCLKLIHHMPPKTFCAGQEGSDSYPSHGDSGSALVVNDYLQVGIVSYKESDLNGVVIYTDISYFAQWIERNVKLLNCNASRRKL